MQALVGATLNKGTTLIVCPTPLVTQWAAAAAEWIPSARCKVLGSAASLQKEQVDADLLVVAYSRLRSIKMDAAVHRVVFDEAHTIPRSRNQESWYLLQHDALTRRTNGETTCRTSSTTVACALVDADTRWALSGTPLSSSEIHSVMAALRIAPFDSWPFYMSMIGSCLGRASYLGGILLPSMLRRTGDFLESTLPGIEHHETTTVVISQQECELANRLWEAMFPVMGVGSQTATFRTMAGGVYDAAILSTGYGRLTPWLHDTHTVGPTVTTPAVEFAADRMDVCPICMSEPVSMPAASTPCDHVFCGHCLMKWTLAKLAVKAQPRCPMCRVEYRIGDIRSTGTLAVDTQAPKRWSEAHEESLKALQELCTQMVDDTGVITLRSNPEAVIGKVRALLEEDESAAILVFCHYFETIRMIAEGVEGAVGMYGDTMQRDRAVEAFRTQQDVRVLVMPYASRMSSGLNLTKANHIVLSEPAQNSGEREQAIGRAWRLGQTRAVHVWPFEPFKP